MKITAIQTSNFLGARAVDVKLSKPITLFAGKNGAGKSSLQEAVRMALIGESVRIDHKKDYAALVSEGQETGFAEVEVDGMRLAEYSVILPSGKGNHSDDPALPYVLDAQRFARLDSNDRRAFLFGLMDLKTDGPAVKERLLGRNCDAKKVEVVAPHLRAGFDAAQKEAQAIRKRDLNGCRESLAWCVERALNQNYSTAVRIAAFLASLYNGDRVKVDVSGIGNFDAEHFEHLMNVLRLCYETHREPHTFFKDGNAIFEHIIKRHGLEKRGRK